MSERHRTGRCHWNRIIVEMTLTLSFSSSSSSSSSWSSLSTNKIFGFRWLVKHLSQMLFKVCISIGLILSIRIPVNEQLGAPVGGNVIGIAGVQAGSHIRLTQRNNHANISELLDNLLQGYDNSIRPGFGGPPATVEVDIMVRSMGPISEVDMTYSMDCYFRQSWVDKRLAFVGAQETLALSVSMLARIWKPDTYFYNGKQSYLHTITTPNKFVRIHQNGRVLYSSRLTIKAGCPMNLEDFPMDIQKCPLKFGSFGYTTSDVVYRWNQERPAVAIAEDMKLSQFDLVDCPAGNSTDTVYKTDPTASESKLSSETTSSSSSSSSLSSKDGDTYSSLSSSGPSAKSGNHIQAEEHSHKTKETLQVSAEYSMLMVNFHLQRHMGNFLIQVYGPCCLLVVLSWVSFWLNREATADRVSLGITTVLTMTFLGLEARTDLPKVGYPTALDFFVFLSFAFIFATILQFAIVHYFTKYGSGECYFIIDTVDSDSESDGDEMTTTTTLKTLSGLPSDYNDSTETKIYEVIPLTMCSIVMPPAQAGASGHCGVGGDIHKRRQSAVKQYSCFGWQCFRKNHKNRNNQNISDEDEEETHLCSGEDLTMPSPASQSSARRRMSYYRREESQARKKGKRTPQFNSVSKIDRASRIVFPLLFFIINVFYWWAYLSRSARILSGREPAT